MESLTTFTRVAPQSLGASVDPSVLHAPSDTGSVDAESSVTDVGRAALDELEERRHGSTTGVSVVTIGTLWTTLSGTLMPRLTLTLRTHIALECLVD